MGVRRTCGEPNEIELTPMGVKLNGSRRVPGDELGHPNLVEHVVVDEPVLEGLAVDHSG